jgi:hypothetical protein
MSIWRKAHRRKFRAAVVIVLAAAASAELAADERWGDVAGADLRRVLSGNTVTGRHDDGMPYSEWHAPDGRVMGHNNRESVDQGCWDIRGDQVCYYYAGGTIRGEFCWEFRRVTEAGFRLRSVMTGMQASGLAQAGNPHGHSDNGKPWTCEPLQSHRSTPRQRHASRPAG